MQISFLKILPENALKFVSKKMRICVKNFAQLHFYQQNVKDSLKHSGMGMYISRLYCEKHGGQLLIENEKQSGAVITAVFHRIA